MYSLNKVQLIGNLTADAEVKQTPSGQKVANFSIATNRTWKDNAGVKQEQVEYHNIVAWGFLADLAEQYFKKGGKLYTEGRLQTRSWEDQSGQKKYRTEIVAENAIMLSGKASGGDEGGYMTPAKEAPAEVTPAKTRKTTKKQEEEIHVEDIPF